MAEERMVQVLEYPGAKSSFVPVEQIKADGLAAVNERRGELKLPALRELPLSVRGSWNTCLVGRCLEDGERAQRACEGDRRLALLERCFENMLLTELEAPGWKAQTVDGWQPTKDLPPLALADAHDHRLDA